ncbi:hypothetical protein EBR21_09960 [bacterium]|nr:hypothetical protein [bacterium]
MFDSRSVDNHTESAGGVIHGRGLPMNFLNRRESEGLTMVRCEISGRLVFSIAVCLLLRTAFASSSAAASSPAPGAVPVGEKATPNPEPYRRRITLPYLKLLAPGQKQAITFEPRDWRFSYICVVGTWNKQSLLVHNYFQKNIDFFVRYKIAVVGAFSHDTIENLTAWAEQMKPRYLFGLAQTEFVDNLKNPKVPSCWLLSREGQILMKHETPTEEVLGSVYDKLKQWTEF